jgi:hypothetical protein
VISLVTQRISRPEDCVLGFGIPTSAERFLASRLHGFSGCFASDFSGLSDYEAQVLEPFRRIGAQIRQLGARVVSDLTLDQYGALFRDGRTHAVTLVSHWGKTFIEFHDGPARVNEIVQTIPSDFAGIIDLCVCHPEKLLPCLRATHLDSVIHYIATKATLFFWLCFYRDLLRLLRPGTRTYMEAAMELKDAYFEARKARP